MTAPEEKIAELVSLLPVFVGTLLEGSKIITPVKLNISEGKTLMILHKHEGSPMTEYSRKVGLSKGSFTTVADHLEKKGLIERVAVSNDRRKYALFLTKEGKRIAREIDLQFKKHIAKKVAQLEQGDLNSLKNSLEIIAAVMEKFK